MDKIDKFLKKLSRKDREVINSLVESIVRGEFSGLDYRKLKGYSNIYRVRTGDIRIIFTTKNSGQVFLISIERRNDNTYNL